MSCSKNILFYTVVTLCLITTVAKEYCQKETLRETCDADEVLLVDSAMYGRMRFGRCAERDYGYIGCRSNVTDILAGMCSARQECQLANLETIFSDNKQCPKDLQSFLEAFFSCIKVDTSGADQCSSQGRINLTHSSAYLASVTTQEHGFGSQKCPWIINGQPGQRINITLFDYADYESINKRQKNPESLTHPKYCREYAIIKEGHSLKNVVACSKEPRKQTVYTSSGHQVAVHIRDLVLESTPSVHFLLQYEVFGCAYPPLPVDMYLTPLSEDQISLRCNNTVDEWTMSCRNGIWHGNFGNCTNRGADAAASESKALPYAVSILIIIGVAVVICFGILFIGLLHIHYRRRPWLAVKGQHRQLEHFEACGTEMKILPNSSTVPRTPRAKHASLDRGYSPMLRTHMRSTVGGEYAHIWELRKPIPVATPEVPKSQSSVQHGDKDSKCNTPKSHSRCKSCSNIIDTKSGHVSFSTFKPPPDHVYESPRSQQACKCKTENVKPSCSSNAKLSKTRLFFEEEKFGVLPERDSSKKQFRHEGQVSV